VALMKSPILTIAIPTFNRAPKVFNQVQALVRQISTHDLTGDVSIVVCDNASTDETRDLIEPILTKVGSQYLRNNSNLGAVKNYCLCLELSKTPFTWVLGDDDGIHDGCLEAVVQELKRSEDVGALFLNARQESGETGEELAAEYYPPKWQGTHSGLKDACEFLGEVHHSAWLWISGSVLATGPACEALSLASKRDNIALPLMVVLFVACGSKWKILPEPALTMVLGNNSWSEKYYRRLYGIDVPAVLYRLKKTGCDFTDVPQFADILGERWRTFAGDVRRRGINALVDLWGSGLH
jgi:glycosyltransferase involved in cell wall biosynthesis